MFCLSPPYPLPPFFLLLFLLSSHEAFLIGKHRHDRMIFWNRVVLSNSTCRSLLAAANHPFHAMPLWKLAPWGMLLGFASPESLFLPCTGLYAELVVSLFCHFPSLILLTISSVSLFFSHFIKLISSLHPIKGPQEMYLYLLHAYKLDVEIFVLQT